MPKNQFNWVHIGTVRWKKLNSRPKSFQKHRYPRIFVNSAIIHHNNRVCTPWNNHWTKRVFDEKVERRHVCCPLQKHVSYWARMVYSSNEGHLWATLEWNSCSSECSTLRPAV